MTVVACYAGLTPSLLPAFSVGCPASDGGSLTHAAIASATRRRSPSGSASPASAASSAASGTCFFSTSVTHRSGDGSGRVLVVGGVNTDPSPVVLATAELYDPAAARWSSTGSMSRERYAHTMTALDDGSGRVLVAGGRDGGNNPVGAAELYDPRTGQWTPAGVMSIARANHRATLLASGRGVLVTGGRDAAYATISSAEVFHLLVGGASCTHGSACESGSCVDGVCCDTACDRGLCDACSVATGSAADGICTALHPECTVFACDPEAGACRTECRSIDDCVSGLVCVPGGRCVPAPAPRDLNDCSLGAPASAGDTLQGIVTALAAVAFVRRRGGILRRWCWRRRTASTRSMPTISASSTTCRSPSRPSAWRAACAACSALPREGARRLLTVTLVVSAALLGLAAGTFVQRPPPPETRATASRPAPASPATAAPVSATTADAGTALSTTANAGIADAETADAGAPAVPKKKKAKVVPVGTARAKPRSPSMVPGGYD